MRIYISTCDRYDHLLPCQAYLLNKHWPGQEVHVLGFREPPKLPENFTFHSMEPVETVPWSTNMRRFFETVEAHHFIFMFDDYFLINRVNNEQIDDAERFLIEENLAKFDLSRCTMMYKNSPYKGLKDKFQASRDAFLRLNTQAAIWTKEFLLKWMNPGLNPWQFEVNQNCVGDEVIVGSDKQILQYANISNHGQIRQSQVDMLPIDVRKEFFIPLQGSFGAGKFSNVLREDVTKGIRCVDSFVRENAFVVCKIVIKRIAFDVGKIIAYYDCRNDNGVTIRQDCRTFSLQDFGMLSGDVFKEGLANIYKKYEEFVAVYCECNMEKEPYLRLAQYSEERKRKSIYIKGDDFKKIVGDNLEKMLSVVSDFIFIDGVGK